MSKCQTCNGRLWVEDHLADHGRTDCHCVQDWVDKWEGKVLVWADGTTQPMKDMEEPYGWMSDDYEVKDVCPKCDGDGWFFCKGGVGQDCDECEGRGYKQ